MEQNKEIAVCGYGGIDARAWLKAIEVAYESLEYFSVTLEECADSICRILGQGFEMISDVFNLLRKTVLSLNKRVTYRPKKNIFSNYTDPILKKDISPTNNEILKEANYGCQYGQRSSI